MTHFAYHSIKYKRAAMVALLFLIACTNAPAQLLRVTLAVSSRPSAYLSEWYRPQNGTVVITSANGVPSERSDIRVETEIMSSDGRIIYKLPYLQSELLQAAGNAVTFPLSSILQLQKGQFSDARLTNSFSNGGRLDAGQYSIRVRLWDGATEKALSEWTAEKVFLISSYQLPQLMQPADGKELDVHQANSAIIFRWTPMTPAPAQGLATYRIQICQVLPGHTPMQSLRSTPPIEDRLIKGATQYIWQPRLNVTTPDPVVTSQFIWTVQTLDEMDMPVPTADPSVEGRSQPYVFSFVSKTPTPDSIAVTINKR